MELHRQRCQFCQSLELGCILRRDEAHPLTVYVRCAKCGELVARYKVGEYYHHGKGMESWLKAMRPGDRESARNFRADFDEVENDSIEEYQEVLEKLGEQGKSY